MYTIIIIITGGTSYSYSYIIIISLQLLRISMLAKKIDKLVIDKHMSV